MKLKCITRQILALLLAIMMIATSVPVFAATGTEATLSINDVKGVPGQTVSVNISIENNPGIAAAFFTVTYNSEAMTLTAAELNQEFGGTYTPAPSLSSPISLTWETSNMSDNMNNGNMFKLTFDISEEADTGEIYDIKISYGAGDISNLDENDVNFQINNGTVTVVNPLPGDINCDQAVNSKDLTRMRKYFANWDVEVDPIALDCNGDGAVNSKDLTRLRKYFANWDVELYYGTITTTKCKHTSLTAIEAKDATCTVDGNIAYWDCDGCDKLFSDANVATEILLADTVIMASGHTEVIDEAVSPTYTSTGLTEGSHCSVCNTVIVAQEIVPALTKNEYSITYRIANSDLYLAGLDIENLNPATYTSEDGVELQGLVVDGYNFKGWYTAQTGGTLVTEISAGTTGSKVLYAQWETVEYTITFDSPDVPVSPVTYTVDKGITLTNPTWFGYTFVGWSMDGRIISIIEPGTTGNLTLHANWTSNRNKAKAVSKLGDPAIIEDMDNGRYLFVYEIGTIENVPLSVIEYIGNSQGITINQEYEYTTSVGEGFANTIANTVSNATTKTSSWTLSEEWNQTTSATNEHEEEIGKTEGKVDSEGNVTGSQYYISNSSGGSTASSSTAGGSNSVSAKVSENNSVGINASYTEEHEESKSSSVEISAGVSTKCGPVKAELSGSAGVEKSETDKTSSTVAGSRESNVGTEQSGSSDTHWDTSSSSSSNWNSTNGYEASKSTSTNRELSNTISEVIFDKYAYTSTDSRSENSSSTSSTGESQELTDEYASTVEYSVEEQTTVKRSITYTSDATGYYRIVNAGTVHVFAVVGYDIATNSYFTYTYNVLDKERHTYLDYSKDNANFNDCENAILPFEVPYSVHEFISNITARSAGLSINPDTGFIDEYTGTAENVIIPEYVSVSNGDGTYSAIRVRGITADAFSGNTTIKAIALPKYVYAIPDGAFEGCTALETVIGYGISEIGTDAFKGCASLGKFTVDKYITALGNNAFEGVSELYVSAVNADVATAAINSGAAKITLNLSDMNANENFDNRKIVIADSTEYFAFISNGASYNNLQIESAAEETFISNVTFKNNTDTPLKLNSDKVTLNRVTIESTPGFAMILSADNTELNLFGNITLTSESENTVISKNVAIVKANAEVSSTLKVTGNYLVYGEIENSKMLSVTNGSLITITEDQFNSYLTSSKITFDANGGIVTENSKTVYYGQLYGELPKPTRDNYTFNGWYTEKDGGTKITSDSVVGALVNQTLYAKWTPNTFTVTYNANGGNVSPASKTLTFGDTYGTLPSPTKDHHDFLGWYTALEGGTKISSDTAIDEAKDITIYAHWTLKDVSGWVKASEVPAGAQVVNRKYTYTERTTSSSSSMPGWTHENTTSAWSDYGAWSAWSRTEVAKTDSRDVDTETRSEWIDTSHYEDRWRYYHWCSSKGPTWIYTYNPGGYTYHEIDLPYEMGISRYQGNVPEYGDYTCPSGHSPWWFKGGYSNDNGVYYHQVWVESGYSNEYKVYRYRDRYLIYTYHFYKNSESSSYPSGANISNIQEWVQYRAK